MYLIDNNYKYVNITEYIESIDILYGDDLFFYDLCQRKFIKHEYEGNKYRNCISNYIINDNHYDYYIRFPLELSDEIIIDKMYKLANKNLNVVRFCYIENTNEMEDILYIAEQFVYYTEYLKRNFNKKIRVS